MERNEEFYRLLGDTIHRTGKIRKDRLHKLYGMAKTLREMIDLYNGIYEDHCDTDVYMCLQIIERIKNTAKSLEDWEMVFQLSRFNSLLEEEAKKAIDALSATNAHTISN